MPKIMSSSFMVGMNKKVRNDLESSHSKGSRPVLPSTLMGMFPTPTILVASLCNGLTSFWYLLPSSPLLPKLLPQRAFPQHMASLATPPTDGVTSGPPVTPWTHMLTLPHNFLLICSCVDLLLPSFLFLFYGPPCPSLFENLLQVLDHLHSYHFCKRPWNCS